MILCLSKLHSLKDVICKFICKMKQSLKIWGGIVFILLHRIWFCKWDCKVDCSGLGMREKPIQLNSRSQTFWGWVSPVYLFLTITDTKGYRILYKNNNTYKLTNAIDRDLLELPEKEIKNYNIDMKYIIKDLLNMIWNSCGEKKSINFNEKGEWIGKDINSDK